VSDNKKNTQMVKTDTEITGETIIPLPKKVLLNQKPKKEKRQNRDNHLLPLS
jgi:hypothetical protein